MPVPAPRVLGYSTSHLRTLWDKGLLSRALFTDQARGEPSLFFNGNYLSWSEMFFFCWSKIWTRHDNRNRLLNCTNTIHNQPTNNALPHIHSPVHHPLHPPHRPRFPNPPLPPRPHPQAPIPPNRQKHRLTQPRRRRRHLHAPTSASTSSTQQPGPEQRCRRARAATRQ